MLYSKFLLVIHFSTSIKIYPLDPEWPLTARGPQPIALPGSPPAPGPLLPGSSQDPSFRVSEKNYHLINSERSAYRAITSSPKKVVFFFKGIINHIFIFLTLRSETTAAFLLRTRRRGRNGVPQGHREGGGCQRPDLSGCRTWGGSEPRARVGLGQASQSSRRAGQGMRSA